MTGRNRTCATERLGSETCCACWLVGGIGVCAARLCWIGGIYEEEGLWFGIRFFFVFDFRFLSLKFPSDFVEHAYWVSEIRRSLILSRIYLCLKRLLVRKRRNGPAYRIASALLQPSWSKSQTRYWETVIINTAYIISIYASPLHSKTTTTQPPTHFSHLTNLPPKMQIILAALRSFQLLFGIVIIGLTATLIKDQVFSGTLPSSIAYAAFAGGFGIVAGVVTIVALWVDVITIIFVLALDALAAVFYIAGGVVRFPFPFLYFEMCEQAGMVLLTCILGPCRQTQGRILQFRQHG